MSVYIMRIKLTLHAHSKHMPLFFKYASFSLCACVFACACSTVYVARAGRHQKFMGYIVANTFAL